MWVVDQRGGGGTGLDQKVVSHCVREVSEQQWRTSNSLVAHCLDLSLRQNDGLLADLHSTVLLERGLA
jgi:hypothetical protein